MVDKSKGDERDGQKWGKPPSEDILKEACVPKNFF